MTAIAPAPSVHSSTITSGPALSLMTPRRASSPVGFEYSPMLNIKTSACPKCAHTFLRYANACPECGFVTRRKKRSRARAKAILSSALAIAAACFFISQIPPAETVFPNAANSQSLSGTFQKPNSRTAQETDKARHILLREADLQKNRTSSIYSAK